MVLAVNGNLHERSRNLLFFFVVVNPVCLLKEFKKNLGRIIINLSNVVSSLL